MDEKMKTWTLRFPAKENPNIEKALFDCPIEQRVAVWRQSEVSIDFSKVLGMKFFHPSFRLTNQKPRAFVSVR